MSQNPIPTPKNDIPWQEMDDILLLAMHNRGLIDVLEDVYGEHIRLDGNTIENLTKVSALLEAILRNAKRLEKRCFWIGVADFETDFFQNAADFSRP